MVFFQLPIAHISPIKKKDIVKKEHYKIYEASYTIQQRRGIFLASDQADRSCIRPKEKKYYFFSICSK